MSETTFDNTLLSTPGRSSNNKKLSLAMMEDLPTRDASRDNSLGILSINSDNCRLSEAGKFRELEMQKAKDSLSICSKGSFNGVPSRFLKPSESQASSYFEYIHSQSTVSESDLTDLNPTTSSTPRQSLIKERVMRDSRFSMGLSNLASSIKSSDFALDNLSSKFQESIQFGIYQRDSSTRAELSTDYSFRSGAEAIAKLDRDELSFKKKEIPVQKSREFSTVGRDSEASLGTFFIQRSDDLPKLFAKSPPKQGRPVALIDPDSPPMKSNFGGKSVHVSDIEHILASSDISPTHFLEMLEEPPEKGSLKKRSTSKVPTDCIPETKDPKKNNMKRRSTSRGPDECILTNYDLKTDKGSLKSRSTSNIPDDCKLKTEEIAKENISPQSTRSSSSLSNLPNGKLPIKTTKTEMIWGCIKPGKTNSQTLIIRNHSGNRVGVQCSLSNPSFRISKDSFELGFLSTVKLILHAYESRDLFLSFSPTKVGAAVDHLRFTATDPNHKQTVEQYVKLFGYGGYGNVTLHNVVRDTSGKYLLAMGNIDEYQHLRQSFLLRNTGNLPTFAYINFGINSLHLSADLEIDPKTVVLISGEEKTINVTYNLKKKDFNFIKSKFCNSVIDIGKLEVIHGTEVDRARLRKVYQKAKVKNQELIPCVSDLVDNFPGEVKIPDLKYFKESISSVEDILKVMYKDEITVTLEQDIDVTINSEFSSETALFQSLCEKTVIESEISTKDIVIEPCRLILTPPDKIKDRIFITNNNKRSLQFEISATPEGLTFTNRSLIVRPGETGSFEVFYMKKSDVKVFKVKISFDSEWFDVDVKVLYCSR